MALEFNIDNIIRLFDQNARIANFEERNDGHSGARVFLIDVTGSTSKFSGKSFLKIVPPGLSKSEYTTHRDLAAAVPEFAEKHMPKIELRQAADVQYLLSTIAGGRQPNPVKAFMVDDVQAETVLAALAVDLLDGRPKTLPPKKGSERESVKPLILGRILQNHEFGPAGRHVLGLQQQVA